jgi:4,5-DOPA dioxygenase extradiol
MCTTMPSLFISHGSPMMGIEPSATTRFLQVLASELPKPKAIVIFSAHFDARDQVRVTGGDSLSTIHDFYGFPQPLYQIDYAAKGALDLAENIAKRISAAGVTVEIDHDRGLDHGAWVPLLYLFPDRDIPVVSVSINSSWDAATHYDLGTLLRSLREDGILFIGSGGISHNLRELFSSRPDPERKCKVVEFTQWVAEKIQTRDVESLVNYLKQAPYASFNHPTPDHYLPLPFILGTTYDDERGKVLHKATEMEILALDAYGFGF